MVDSGQPPGVVLRQLGNAADKGAVWDGPVSSILPRAITERLREARDAAAKSTAFKQPDYDEAPSPF